MAKILISNFIAELSIIYKYIIDIIKIKDKARFAKIESKTNFLLLFLYLLKSNKSLTGKKYIPNTTETKE